jgi:N,N'-diacetyllegionaminate synthase
MSNKVIIIAEAGVNHNGDFNLAKKLIDVAAIAGADYVKFQTFKADKIVNRNAIKAEYQLKNIESNDNSQYTMLKQLELPEQWHYDLIEYSKEKGISFLSTGFDEDTIDFLDSIGLPLFKIPSGEITNKPYLAHIAKKRKPIIISTGMANMKEIGEAIDVILSNNFPLEMITILHCNTEYPTPMIDVDLLSMKTIENKFGVKVGYSDHTLGIEVPIAAVALGGLVIEKHFTLDRNMIGPDHKASLEPLELKEMIKAIRNIEKAISGPGLKEVSNSEIKNKIPARKSIYLNKSIEKGQKIAEKDLVMLRPGDGISPMLIDQVVGKTSNTKLEKGKKIEWVHLV